MSTPPIQDVSGSDVTDSLIQKFTTDPTIQLQYMKALNSPEFDVTALIDSLNQLADDVTCRGECQTAKVRLLLKEAYDQALVNYTEAPDRLRTAERDYIVYDQGAQAYYDLLLQRHTKTADELKAQLTAEHAQDLRIVNDELAQLETNMQALETIYANTVQAAQDYVKMQSNKQHLQTVLHTNGRQVFYESRELERQQTYQTILWILYYGLIVLYVIFGNFFPSSQYANKGFWVYVALYAAVPWLLKYVVQAMFQLVVWLKFFFGNLAPKNVYLRI